MALLDPPPLIAPIAGNYLLGADWIRWVNLLWSLFSTQPQVAGSQVALTAQSASILTTSIPLPALANGWYRLSYYARKTTADGVSSSLQIAFGWTESGSSLTHAFTANAVDSTGSDSVDSGSWNVLIDQNTSLTYATTYASNTPGAMRYRLQIAVEFLPNL